MPLTIVVLTHLHTEDVPLARSDGLELPEGVRIWSAVAQNHSVPGVVRTSLTGTSEDANVERSS